MRLVTVLVRFLSSLRIFLAAGTTAFALTGAPPPPPPGGAPAAAAAARPDRASAVGAGAGRNPPVSPAMPRSAARKAAKKASRSEAVRGGGGDGDGDGISRPSHLVVLSHGLVGTPEDLTYVKQSLERAAERAGEAGTLVHSARCNAGKTKDGVEKGGTRLAEEIRELVRSTPSLSRISLVGNSFGGLYVRYAAKLLYDAGDAGDGAEGGDSAGSEPGGGGGGKETVAGLTPSMFMTIASPHLGVRRYTYVPLPTPLHPLAGVVVGQTGNDLFLKIDKQEDKTSGEGGVGVEGEKASGAGEEATAAGRPATDGRETAVLYEMATSEEFLRPLKAFRRRRAYANFRGDFLVPFATGVFLEPGEGADSADDPEGDKAGPAAATQGGASPAVAGARDGSGSGAGGDSSAAAYGMDDDDEVAAMSGTFTIMDRLLGAKQGAIVRMSCVSPTGDVVTTTAAPAPVSAAPEEEQEESPARVGPRKRVSARVRRSLHKRADSARQGVKTKTSMEAEMAAGLNSCGWEKVAVDFGGLAPFSHNKICALSRNRYTKALYSSGRSVVDHAAKFLIENDRKHLGGGADSSAGDTAVIPPSTPADAHTR